MKTTAQTDTTDRQLGFSFDLAPCGPVADAAAERQLIADIREKVDCEDFTDPWDLHTPDFPDDV
jgi:hypothetical protein